ncbi:hypothetical protein [Pandoraea sp. ISTKB]|uniref:hypothetical protein n=1 Tax=Pandoraea sp. ISTKB TaxID=1586708 RepID=UPI0008468C4C|nr:hypothetical protein [Pandoraea sp. ISTKB]ODP35115.1 hypothetical protein A9762_12195 [Pandoraea sp. ISTKB]
MEFSGILSSLAKALSALGAKLKAEPKARSGDGSGIAVVSGFQNKTEVNVTNNIGPTSPTPKALPPKWRVEVTGYSSTEQELSFALKNVGAQASSVEIISDADVLIFECGTIGPDGARTFKHQWPGQALPTTLHWTIRWSDAVGASARCAITGTRTTSGWTFTTWP